MKRVKRVLGRKLRRNPHARALASPLFQAKVEKKPDSYRRRPKHPKPPDNSSE